MLVPYFPTNFQKASMESVKRNADFYINRLISGSYFLYFQSAYILNQLSQGLEPWSSG